MLTTYLNRAVAVLTVVAGLSAAVLVPLANLDLSSTAGVVAGLGAVVAAAVKWLDGWQKHEAHVASLEEAEVYAAAVDPTVLPDV